MNTGFVRGIRRIRPVFAVAAMLALASGVASAAKLSGTVTIQNGSSEGPIRIFVMRLGFPGTLAGADFIARPGAWEVDGLSNGTYFVLGWADQNANIVIDRSEPVGFHGGRFPAAVNITNNRSVAGVDVTLEPMSVAAELRGTITRSGPELGRLWVVPHLGAEFDLLNVRGTPWTTMSTGEFRTFMFLDDTYYVSAFIDTNSNLLYDFGEPIGTSKAVNVQVSPTAVYRDVNIVIGVTARTPVAEKTWSSVKALYRD